VVQGACTRVVLSPVGVGITFIVIVLAVVSWASMAGVLAWWALAALGIVTLLTLLLATGALLAAGLSKTYFGVDGKATLGALKDRAVAHEFCATDLVTGMPVTFSTRHGVARRRVPRPASQRGAEVQVWTVPATKLAVVVRSSAAFPGIAPKIVRFPKAAQQAVASLVLDGFSFTTPRTLGKVALCADGGNWNNLGTQAIREEGDDHGRPVVCVNASAPGKTTKPTLFYVPGIALIMAMYRSMTILSRNTVEPRVDSINRDLQRRARTLTAPDPDGDPLTVVADMRPISSMRLAMAKLAHQTPTPTDGRGRPDIGAKELEDLENRPWWKSLAAIDTDEEIHVGTNFTRVKRDEAMLLLVRGYANTWLASLLVKPFNREDESDTNIASRLQELIGK
jgi:hypothetical protein